MVVAAVAEGGTLVWASALVVVAKAARCTPDLVSPSCEKCTRARESSGTRRRSTRTAAGSGSRWWEVVCWDVSSA